jgi:hypothetical protein
MTDTVNFARLLLTLGSQLLIVFGLCFIFISVVLTTNSVSGWMIGIFKLLGGLVAGDNKSMPSMHDVFNVTNFNLMFLIFCCLVGGLILRKLGNWLGSKELIESVEEFTGGGKERGPGERAHR